MNTALSVVQAFKESTQGLSSDQQTAFLCSQVTGLGLMIGAIALVVGTFFGFDRLYPATITGFFLCAWAGTHFSLTPQLEVLDQEFRCKLLSLLPKSVKQYLNVTPAPKWLEFKKWPAVSNNHTLPPPESFLKALIELFSTPPSQFAVVCAYTNGTGIKYEILNLQTQAKNSGDIPLAGRSLKQMMNHLNNCFVALENDGTPVFSQSCHSLSIATKSGTTRYELLLRQKDLIWNIYQEDDRVISTKETPFSYRCSDDTLKLFQTAQKGSLTDQILFARELVLYKNDSDSISFEPIHDHSGFHEEVLISKFMWAVTLIRYKGISGNHAEIVIEGINDGFFPQEYASIGKYFMYLADLTGTQMVKKDGKEREVRAIRSILKDKFLLRYEERSTTWKRTSEHVKDMINAIETEKADPPSGFALYGRHSFLASKKIVEDSCITWALDKLAKIHIVLGKSPHSQFFTDTSHYTRYKQDQKDPFVLDTILYFIVDDSKKI